MKDFGSESGAIQKHVEIMKGLGVDSPTIFDVGGNHGLISAQYFNSFYNKKIKFQYLFILGVVFQLKLESNSNSS